MFGKCWLNRNNAILKIIRKGKNMKIKKYQIISCLEIFKEKGCKTIDEAIKLLNKELKNDTDVVFTLKEGKSSE